MAQRLTTRPQVLADGWYSWIGRRFVPLTQVLERLPAPLRKPILRVGPLRGLALAALSTRYDGVALIRHDPGWRSLLLARALLGRRRKLVVLQLIDHPLGGDGVGALRERGWRALERWALRRATAGAQVLSSAERAAYPAQFRLPPERFGLIPFAWRSSPPGSPPPPSADGRDAEVIAAGRAYCDWPTLLAAAADRGFPLTIVCSGRDRDEIEALDRRHRAGATILSDIPHEQAHQLLQRAWVAVICVRDGLPSRGQVRLCDAVEAGAAVIATRTGSLEAYVDSGRSALLVRPGDPDALRHEIQRLLGDSALRDRLAAAAFERGARWTGQDYVAALEDFAFACAGARAPK